MDTTRRAKDADEGSAEDLWRHTLSQIPSSFGRLVYLASLRDQNTGRYEHHGLSQMFGEDESDQALRQSHEETFAGWLGFDLERQKEDLDLYLSAAGPLPQPDSYDRARTRAPSLSYGHRGYSGTAE
jgi:hypothetical protein